MDDVLTLIALDITTDENGVEQETETRRDVFVRTNSIGQREFFEASRQGLKPEYRFVVHEADYNGEAFCEFHGQRYTIYRTYKANITSAVYHQELLRDELKMDYIELYVTAKGGSNG